MNNLDMVKRIICVGAVYIDTILSVPTYPIEDEKLRATGCSRRRGGNCANTLEVLSQLVEQRNSPAAEGQVALYLLSVLPTRDSSDAQFIGKSLQGVDIDKGCVFRESFENAAASYIIQSTTNSSRTIVSHNPLPEMTTREFINSASNIQRQSGAASYWYHFEGRIPTVTGESVDWLRSEVPLAKISVECEKPERAYMMDVSKRADVVFFSKIWAESGKGFTHERLKRAFLAPGFESSFFTYWQQANSYKKPHAFLGDQVSDMKPGAILVCTWGSEGATCVQNKIHEGEDEQWASVKAWKPLQGSVEVVDTIGAGDTFIAGFIYAQNCHEAWTLQQKLEFANELAGRKVRQVGFTGLAEQMKMLDDVLA